MHESADVLVRKLQQQDGQGIDLVAACRAFHLSSAGRAMFNVNLKCVDSYPQNNPITNAFAYFLQELPRRSFDRDPAVAQDYKTENEDNKKMWAASKAVHDIVLEVVRDRMSGRGCTSRNDMLNQMVAAYKKEHGKDVTPEQVESALGANLVELLFAGYNTVVNTIASALYLLSTNPAKLQKVRQEMDAVLGGKKVTADNIEKLTYLHMVFKETLRIYPPAPAIARRIQKDEKLGQISIPKDAECMFSMAGLHNDPANWKDPEKFQPERFEHKIKDGTVVPFSGGPRSCIGQHFARYEFIVLVTELLRKFDFTPSPGYNFGMMFNGFGWMACDMTNMWGGSCLKMQVVAKEKPGASPWVLVAGIAAVAIGIAYLKNKQNNA